MPTASRLVLSITALALASGCFIADGEYVVRGTVFGAAPASPLAGAWVIVGDLDAQSANGKALTERDGSYVARYRFGGMFPFIRGGDPSVTFSAPGYRTCRFRLRDTADVSGVRRLPCEPPRKGCYAIDVSLAPALGAAPSNPPVAWCEAR